MNSNIRRAACVGILLVAASLVLIQSVSAAQISKTQYVGGNPVYINLLSTVSQGHTYTVTGINQGWFNSVTMWAQFDNYYMYGGSSYPPGAVYTCSKVADVHSQYVSLFAQSWGAWIAEPVKATVDY